ncbi:hypothetical protein A3Q56_08298 [Intoshia linei]|uniref:Uncharacterized protein n=1 Tax=Intoshia linei TaxID=1819745 RepID=A0A177APR0_9BILA|nr:hypothetical protein A3Q56_08298 [Intoshia linei]
MPKIKERNSKIKARDFIDTVPILSKSSVNIISKRINAKSRDRCSLNEPFNVKLKSISYRDDIKNMLESDESRMNIFDIELLENKLTGFENSLNLFMKPKKLQKNSTRCNIIYPLLCQEEKEDLQFMLEESFIEYSCMVDTQVKLQSRINVLEKKLLLVKDNLESSINKRSVNNLKTTISILNYDKEKSAKINRALKNTITFKN